MVIFLDTNVVIDYFDEREYSKEAERIFDYCSNDENEGVIASLSLSTFFYLFRKKLTVKERKDDIRMLAELFTIGTVDEGTVKMALELDMNDYEDAIQAACASKYQAALIITNNIRDFANSTVKAVTSKEFVDSYC